VYQVVLSLSHMRAWELDYQHVSYKFKRAPQFL